MSCLVIGYDDDSQPKTVYNGKVDKLLKKTGGTHVVEYWSEEETYQDDAVDYDISKYALAADMVCEDLILCIYCKSIGTFDPVIRTPLINCLLAVTLPKVFRLGRDRVKF